MPNHKYNSKYILIFIFFFPTILLSDIPKYDIIQVQFNKKNYYVAGYFKTGGILMNHDLCYYDSSGEYIGEVADFVRDYSSDEDSIMLFSSLQMINIKKLTCYEEYDDGSESLDHILKALSNGINVCMKDFRNEFALLDAFHGNTGGFTHTPEINENDNIWINQNEIENLFCLDGHVLCSYGFYTIKGTLNKKAKRKLELELEFLLSNDLEDKFWIKLSELYKKQIIMVGLCSC